MLCSFIKAKYHSVGLNWLWHVVDILGYKQLKKKNLKSSYLIIVLSVEDELRQGDCYRLNCEYVTEPAH